MKKNLLIVWAAILCSLTSYAQQANIYASGLSAAAPGAENVDISYFLNTNATAVAINFINATSGKVVATVPLTDAALLTKGAHTATVPYGTNVPSGTWKYAVTATAAANTGTNPVKVTTGTEPLLSFAYSRGIAIDNNLESPFFGRIYIASSSTSGTPANGRTVTKGIYILGPDLSDITGQGDTGYTGGEAWTTSASSLMKVAIGPDGKVYMNDWTDGHSGIWVMNPANPSANFTEVLGGTRNVSNGAAKNANDEYIHGSISSSCWVTGTGENMKLYSVDEDYQKTVLGLSGDNAVVLQYNIGTSAFPYTQAPVLFYNPTPTSLLPNWGSIAPDGKGGWWICQSRAKDSDDANHPSLIHLTAAGIRDYEEVTGLLGASLGGAISVSEDGTLMAVGGTRTADGTNTNQVSIYNVTFDKDGVPSLNTPLVIQATGVESSGVQLDKAGNLYVSSGPNQGAKTLSVYALPKTENTFTTPAPQAATITVNNPNYVVPPLAAGTYYVPNDPGDGSNWYASLTDAFTAINTVGIAGNITLLVNGDIAQTQNVGLINNTEYSITIRPVFTPEEATDAVRTITFNKTTDNAGPSGAICLGIGMGIAWNEIAPAKNITIDGSVGDATDRRLKIATSATQNGLNGPILILDECSNIVIKNTIIEHVGAANGNSNYAIYLRVNTAYGSKKMPVNVSILNNEIINMIAGAASQGIGVYANAEPEAPSTGIVIEDNIIRARTRGIFLNEINGIEITGNEIHMNQSSGGLSSAAIFGNSRINGDIKVTANRFVELKSANTNAGDYGMKAIITGGATSTWYIDNNYFTGFDKTTATAGNTMLQGIRLGALAASYIRHNTFYMNPITEANRPTNLATPTATDGSYSAINIAAGTPVIQNNLFVSDEDAFPNFFIRGNAPDATDNNIFSLPAGAANAKIASGTAATDLKMVDNVIFADAAAGDLDLTGASNKDRKLGVAPLANVLYDIYGTLRSTTLTYAGAFEGEPFGQTDLNVVSVSEIRITTQGNQITVKVPSGSRIESVKIYDLQGRTIVSQQAVSTDVYSTTAPGKGVYIVETRMNGTRNVQKIIVR